MAEINKELKRKIFILIHENNHVRANGERCTFCPFSARVIKDGYGCTDFEYGSVPDDVFMKRILGTDGILISNLPSKVVDFILDIFSPTTLS